MNGKCFVQLKKIPARPLKPWATGKAGTSELPMAFILMLTFGLTHSLLILHFCSLPLFFRISSVLLTFYFFFSGVPLHLATPCTSQQSSLTHGSSTWIWHLNRNSAFHLWFLIFLKISLPSVLLRDHLSAEILSVTLHFFFSHMVALLASCTVQYPVAEHQASSHSNCLCHLACSVQIILPFWTQTLDSRTILACKTFPKFCSVNH